ncbi:MAG: hypothetical protein RLZZ09_2800 [Pseudomonadota bacterium]|jgi:hypothetical protein
MKTTPRVMSLALLVAAIFGSTSAYCDTSKTFTFENADKFNVGPLLMYVEDSQCIADPAALLSQFGTLEAPRVLGAKAKATAIVSPASGDSECAGDGKARFILRFFEEASVDTEGVGNPQRISSVTFTLGKHNILDIDNQGPGGFSIVDVGSKTTHATAPSYSIDWQQLQASRRDVVYAKNGQLEATLQCINRTRKACNGRLSVSPRWADGGAGASTILAKGSYTIPYSKTKSVPLNLTKPGRELLKKVRMTASTASANVALNAKPNGSGPTLSLGTANIPTLPAAVQGAQLSLNVINNSSSMISACLFQQPQNQLPGLFPVVWLSAPMYPGMRRSFAWSNNDYSFVWAETGWLMPGTTFNPSQVTLANIGDQITFNVGSGGYGQFFNQTPSVPPNNLTITDGGNMNPGQFAVGVGLSGSPVYVAQAQPNMAYQFTPSSNRIYLFAGNCQTGDVLDTQTISNAALINYAGQTQATATLQMNGMWNVTMGGGL